MEAPRILYTRDVRARPGQRAAFAPGSTKPGVRSRRAPRSARGDGPVRVEAEQGSLRDEPPSFLFVGESGPGGATTSWSADELRGDEAEDRLTATGSVRTLWNPDEDERLGRRGRPPSRSRRTSWSTPGPAPLVYTGDVTAEQERLKRTVD